MVSTVQAIQNYYPNSKLTWVLGKVEYALLKDLPGVEFVVFDKSLGWGALKQLRQDLAGRQFDVLLHMQVSLRANLAALCIKAKRKLGYHKSRAKELHSLVINEQVKMPTSLHVLDGFRAFATAIGVPESPASWRIPIAEADMTFANQYIPDGQKTLVISPAASKAERNWLASRYAQVAEYAIAQGYRVILCGGPGTLDRELADQVQQHSKQQLTDLVGKTSLKQLLALLNRASLVIVPDTGPGHMAVTQNTPVIGLYAHSNPARTGPYLYQDYVCEVYHTNLKQLTGKDAQHHKYGYRLKGEHLMAQISVAQVTAMFDKVVRDFNLH